MKRIRWTAFAGVALATLALIGTAGNASAQASDFPAIAVIDFDVNTAHVDNAALGAMAAAAVRGEMAKLGTADIVPVETIKRTIEELGWQTAPKERAALIRLGQNLNVDTLIVGTVLDARVDSVGNGRQARVLVSMEMRDVASGLTINGAQTIGTSGVRTGEVANSSLYGDAVNAMAFDAVREMANRQLPSATVLNTLKDQALVNRGARSGFRPGMQVIIVRGRDQVGSATVGQVDPDSAFINFGTLIKGVQPGDKVRTLYSPEKVFTEILPDGSARTKRGARGGSNSGIVSLLLVVLALAFLLGQGRGSNTTLASVKSESIMSAGDQPGVMVSWTRDPFLRGNSEGPFQWQVWRNDGSTTPVAVADGTQGNIIDDAVGTNAGGWYDLTGASNTQCNDLPDTTDPGANALVAGTPYQYSVEVVYRVSGLSLPGSGSSGGGGNTGGATTGVTTGGTTAGTTTGVTTGGTTAGTTTTGGGGGTTGQTQEWCYFISKRINAVGLATPLVRPELRSPDPDQIVTTPITFQFSSVRGPVVSVQLFYVVQLSTSPAFPAGSQTVTLTEFIELTEPGGSTVSSPTIDTSSFFPGAVDVFWRVGVRNPADKPGPRPDANNQRYIFSAVRRFKRSGIPPGPGPGGGL